MDIQAVRRSYARWAPIYDLTFGRITGAGRTRAVDVLNRLGGKVLELGVGTGLALPHYRPGVEVTGIDASAEMLEKARTRVAELGLGHVRDLLEMDARKLAFPAASFDHVAAMHIMSVVPEPDRVMAEICRVLRPGGSLLIVNHFARDEGALSVVERMVAPLADMIGWHSDFHRATILDAPGFTLVEEAALPPFGMMTFLRLCRD